MVRWFIKEGEVRVMIPFLALFLVGVVVAFYYIVKKECLVLGGGFCLKEGHESIL